MDARRLFRRNVCADGGQSANHSPDAMTDAERPMRRATVRALGALLVAFAVSLVLTKAAALADDWRLASSDAIFDFVVARELVEAAVAIAIAAAAFFAGRWLLRRPERAARALMSLAVITVAVSLAVGVKALDEEATPLTPRQREAFEYLRHADTLEMRAVGIAGSRSNGYLAMRILRRSAGADAAFKELLRSGTSAGQLYGLCGIHDTDPMAFAGALPRYRASIETIGIMSGCVTRPQRISDVACSDHGIRLPRGVALDEWWQRAGDQERDGEPDICGGAIPAEFRERDYDETAALIDERLAVFRNGS